MHVQTHLLSGWCIANYLDLSPRERLFAMIAAAAADVDGISRVAGEEAYEQWHHTFGHNLWFALIVSAGLAAFSSRRWFALLLYLGLFHLHLLMDYYGSGPGWPIYYLWPMKVALLRNPNAWEFYSWQNLTIFAALLAWTVWIAIRRGRTPLEAIMPSLDAKIVAWLRKRFGYNPAVRSAGAMAAAPEGRKPS